MFEYHIIDTTNANYQSGTHFILGKKTLHLTPNRKSCGSLSFSPTRRCVIFTFFKAYNVNFEKIIWITVLTRLKNDKIYLF